MTISSLRTRLSFGIATVLPFLGSYSASTTKSPTSLTVSQFCRWPGFHFGAGKDCVKMWPASHKVDCVIQSVGIGSREESGYSANFLADAVSLPWNEDDPGMAVAAGEEFRV